MKPISHAFVSFFILLFSISLSFAQTPVSKYGKVKLVGKQLSSECGKPVQLRGMSSHGLHWHANCLNGTSLPILANSWKVDMIRLAMYVGENGYLTDPAFYRSLVDEYVDFIGSYGLYCIIDWHVLTPGNPNTNIEEAKFFWDYMSRKHGGKKHVIYEICNEPNGVDWNTVKTYANTIIPIIRANDKESIIIVGTPDHSSNIDAPANDPIIGTNAYNVMYTFHFYAASHMNKLSNFNTNTAKIPLFVTEWGLSTYTGGGNIDISGGQQWMNNFNGTNAGSVKISWANWSFSDVTESSGALAPNSCNTDVFTNTTASGTQVKAWLTTPANSSEACVFGPTCKTPSLGSDVSLCGTTTGLTLNSGLTQANRTFSWKRNNAVITGSGPTLNVALAGTYSVTVDSAGCSKTDEIVVSATLPTVNLASQAKNLCNPAKATLDAGVSGTGISYVWKKGSQIIGGNTKAIQVSEAGTYSVTVSASGCTSTSGSVNITSSLPTVIGDTVCTSGTANLSVIGTGTYNWYSSGLGGTPLKTGNTYNPVVSNTATFYVEASAGQDYIMGPSNSGTAPWDITDYATNDKKIAIQALANVTLKSITVDALAAQSITLNITDQTSATVVKSATMSVQAGLSAIALNFNLVSGKTYTVDAVGSTGALKFRQNSVTTTQANGWPQTTANVATITAGASHSNGWTAFYNITFSTGSSCSRVAVVASVSSCTGLEDDISSFAKTNIYPNPFQDNFTVNLGYSKDVQKVELTDLEGKTIETIQGNNFATEIQMGANLTNGQYFVRIIRSGKVEVKSVIKLK